MRIGVDARVLLKPKTGIGRYLRNLIANLLLIDEKNKYILFMDKKGDFDFSAPNCKERVIWLLNLGKEWIRHLGSPIWMNLYLPWGLKREHIDLLFCPNSISPIRRTCKKLLVIHDFYRILFPKLGDKFYTFYLRKTFLSEMEKVSKIITVSHNSKKDVIESFNVPEDKIKTIHSGVESIFEPINDRKLLNERLQKYDLVAKDFILYVGGLNYRKNVIRLINAYYELRKSKIVKHRLVIVGGEKRPYLYIEKVVKTLGLENDVILTGYVADEDLPYIYSKADLFVYPSLYEGFGFPPLEAMACGTPVVSSNVSSIPEITEDAAVLVNPNDTNAIAKGISEVLTNDDLRQSMIRRGLKRAKHFSWRNTAKETLDIFEEVCQEGGNCR